MIPDNNMSDDLEKMIDDAAEIEKNNQQEKNLAKSGFKRNEFEPKDDRRFIVKMTNDKGEEIVPFYVIHSVSRPAFRCERVELPTPHFWEDENEPEERKYSWLPLTMKLYDPIFPSTTGALVPFFDKNEKFKLLINLLGPVGDKVEEWEILGCKVIEADFGALDRKNDNEPITITLKIRFDYAVFQY